MRLLGVKRILIRGVGGVGGVEGSNRPNFFAPLQFVAIYLFQFVRLGFFYQVVSRKTTLTSIAN